MKMFHNLLPKNVKRRLCYYHKQNAKPLL